MRVALPRVVAPPLVHPAIDQQPTGGALDEVHRTGHLLRRTEEAYVDHRSSLLRFARRFFPDDAPSDRPGPMRVASLLPSSTEIVCALGAGEQLVARSHECDFPAWVRRLPAVTAPKLPLDGTSHDIDARVKAV